MVAASLGLAAIHVPLEKPLGHVREHRLELRLVDVLTFAREIAIEQRGEESRKRPSKPAFGSGYETPISAGP